MAISLHDELDTLYDKFDQAERKWLNRFDDLDAHFDTAARNFTSNLPKGSAASTAAQDTVEIGSSVVLGYMGLSGGPAAIAVPIVMGLQKLASMVDGGAVDAPDSDILSIQIKFKEIRRAFKRTTEYLGDQIIDLKDKAANSSATEQEIRSTISKILISPLWYPPLTSVTSNTSIAAGLETRMWFAYFEKLASLPSPQQIHIPRTVAMASTMAPIDYSPMYKRFKALGFAPAGIEVQSIDDFYYAFIPGKAGNNPDVLKAMTAYGKKIGAYKLQHTYPKAVQSYLQTFKIYNDVNEYLRSSNVPVKVKWPDSKSLPDSNLTWADAGV